jgi:hypothetical protein
MAQVAEGLPGKLEAQSSNQIPVPQKKKKFLKVYWNTATAIPILLHMTQQSSCVKDHMACKT